MEQSESIKLSDYDYCENNINYFINNFCYLSTYDNDKVQFKLYDYQNEVLNAILEDKNVIVLKARQMGMTWLSIAYCLHELIYSKNNTFIVFTVTAESAKAFMNKLLNMYGCLPTEFKNCDITHTRGEIKNNKTNTNILCVSNMNGVDHFRSMRIDNEATLLFDDAGDIDKLNEKLEVIMPCLTNIKSKIFIGSLGNEAFTEMWVNTILGKTGYTPIKLPYNLSPDGLETLKRVYSSHSSEQLVREFLL